MNSKEIWNLLESLETKDIQVLLTMSVRYLEYNRNINFKKIIKDIKESKRVLDNKYYRVTEE